MTTRLRPSPQVVAAALSAALMPRVALAAEASTFGAALQAIAGLGVVLLMIVATALVLKRLQPGRFGTSALLKPIAQLSVGTRERVVVVEMGETWLVLGVTAQSITTLHTAEKGELPVTAAPNSPSLPFAEWLARARAPHAKP